MSRFRITLAAAALAIAVTSAGPMLAQGTGAPKPVFAKIAVPKGEKTAAIMFEAPIVFGDYTLLLSPLTDDGQYTQNAETFKVREKNAAWTNPKTTLQLKAAKPGDYVVRMMTTQTWWGGCFSESTVKFTVEPGKVTYLGRLDPLTSLESITAELVRTGKTTSSSGQLRLMKENMIPPSFTMTGAAAPEEALRIAKAAGFKPDLPVVTAATAPASFKRRDKTDLTGYCQ
ncbi:MAG TPA: hypothetical protein VLA50_07530 [Erythrobacter sp.]|nr:hypothetical protein [Erythrobacter sp.]